MQVQVNSDHTIQQDASLEAWVTSEVESALSHSKSHITRVEVHLSDENGQKGGDDDKRCMMEARLEGRNPVAVTNHAATLDRAVSDAAGKLGRLIKSTIARAAQY